MTAATSVLPDLDAETVEELRPPCDTTYRSPFGSVKPCSNPAEWVSRIRCDACREVHKGLMCEPHRVYFFDRHSVAVCRSCGLQRMPYTCLSVERL